MNRIRTLTLSSCLAMAASVLLLAGCHDQRFAAKRHVRREHMRSATRLCAACEATSPGCLRHVVDVHRELDEKHAKRLRATAQLILDRYHRSVRQWREQSPARRDRLRAMLAGEPAAIPEFIAHTVY